MSVVESLKQTCLFEGENVLDIIKRKKEAPLAIQGMGYWEQSKVRLKLDDFLKVQEKLNNNPLYKITIDKSGFSTYVYNNNDFNKSCSLLKDNTIEYNLTYK